MRAAVYVPGADDLVVETVTPLPPADRDVTVHVSASGVCHSDQAVIDGKRLGPIMLGHEATGIVEWTGTAVTRVRPGDRVIASITPVCGTCWHCLRQETHLCDRNADMLPRLRATRPDGREVYINRGAMAIRLVDGVRVGRVTGGGIDCGSVFPGVIPGIRRYGCGRAIGANQ